MTLAVPVRPVRQAAETTRIYVADEPKDSRDRHH